MKLSALALPAALLLAGLVAVPAIGDDAEVERLKKQLAELQQRLTNQGRTPSVSAGPPSAAAALAGAELLPDARAGQCFAKVQVPAQYSQAPEQVVVRDASHEIEIVPAKYEWVTERVAIKEASSKLVPVPAVYGTAKEQIVIEPARTVWRSGRGPNSPIAKSSLVRAASAAGLPSAIKPGACFSQYYEPARFEDKQEKVVRKEAAQRIEVVPARYEWVDQKVLVKEKSEKIIEVPAVYETVTEKVLKTAAYTTWKKGRGPIERVDHATGEILCRVEVPATYETVKKRVLKTPASTKKMEIPAEYQTVRVRKLVAGPQEKKIDVPAETITVARRQQIAEERVTWRQEGSKGAGKATGALLCGSEIPAQTKVITKSVLKTPATVNKIEIPAEYKTVKVRKLVTPAQEKRVNVPAITKTITKRVLTNPGKLTWQPVLCETNTTPTLITDLQRALQEQGFNPGPIDGVVGRQTLTALESFQQKKGLATGGVTTQALAALGVKTN